MMIVGVNDRAATVAVGMNNDAVALDFKCPALRVVARRGERSIPDEFYYQRGSVAE